MEFVGSIARKTGEPSVLAVEAAKTKLAHKIGKESGLFYVPKVVRFDSKAGVLEFERMEGLVTLQQLIIDRDPRSRELSQKAGRALAVIHEKLVLPDEMKYELPPEWMGTDDDNVFIHGDFNCINVGFHETTERLVILDWSTAPLMGRTPTFGSRYFDVLWFASYMFRVVSNIRLLNWDPERTAKAFLEAYAEGTSKMNIDNLKYYLPSIRRLQRENIMYLARRRTRIRALAYILSQVFMYGRLRLFLGNYG